MANIVDCQITNESEAAVTIRVYLQGDGTSGELLNVPLLAVSELTPKLLTQAYLGVEEIWYNITNFTVQLSYKTITGPVPFWTLNPSTSNYQDFARFGSLVDTSGMFAQGQLLISTKGFSSPASQGSLVIRLEKNTGKPPVYTRCGLPGLNPLVNNLLGN